MEMNIAEILNDVVPGTKLYSPCYGEVEFRNVNLLGEITCKDEAGCIHKFFVNGSIHNYGECMLFPSKECRDWRGFQEQRFDVTTLQPFDKVLVRDDDDEFWGINLFERYMYDNDTPYYCLSTIYAQLVPYNDNTKHLLGTDKKAPWFYRVWEKEE